MGVFTAKFGFRGASETLPQEGKRFHSTPFQRVSKDSPNPNSRWFFAASGELGMLEDPWRGENVGKKKAGKGFGSGIFMEKSGFTGASETLWKGIGWKGFASRERELQGILLPHFTGINRGNSGVLPLPGGGEGGNSQSRDCHLRVPSPQRHLPDGEGAGQGAGEEQPAPASQNPGASSIPGAASEGWEGAEPSVGHTGGISRIGCGGIPSFFSRSHSPAGPCTSRHPRTTSWLPSCNSR